VRLGPVHQHVHRGAGDNLGARLASSGTSSTATCATTRARPRRGRPVLLGTNARAGSQHRPQRHRQRARGERRVLRHSQAGSSGQHRGPTLSRGAHPAAAAATPRTATVTDAITADATADATAAATINAANAATATAT
jgi:hypothetical protein